jgi:hypothetical protein
LPKVFQGIEVFNLEELFQQEAHFFKEEFRKNKEKLN